MTKLNQKINDALLELYPLGDKVKAYAHDLYLMLEAEKITKNMVLGYEVHDKVEKLTKEFDRAVREYSSKREKFLMMIDNKNLASLGLNDFNYPPSAIDLVNKTIEEILQGS